MLLLCPLPEERHSITMETTGTTALSPGNRPPTPNQHPWRVQLTARMSRDFRECRDRGGGIPIEADFTGTDCQLATFSGRVVLTKG